MKRVLILLSISILLWSCEKEDFQDQQKLIVKKLDPDIWTTAANPNNPYEDYFFGIYHNHCLNYCKDGRVNYQSDSAWVKHISSFVKDYFCAGDDIRYCDPLITNELLNAIVDTADSPLYFSASISRLPDQVKTYINTCLGIFDTYQSTQYDSLYIAIVDLEQAIVNDATLQTEHAKLLLKATQIARYSGIYWKQELSEDFKDWMTIINMDETDYAAVVKMDIRGTVVGYLNGKHEVEATNYAINGGAKASMKKASQFLQ